MAITLDSQNISVSYRATYNNALDLDTAAASFAKNFTDLMVTGTAIDQADVLWYDTRSISAAEDLDMTALTGNNPFEATITFAKLKLIFIHNKSATVGEILNVGGDGAAAMVNWVGNATDIVNIGPGGVLFLYNPAAAGYAVTATTADLLQIAPAAGTIAYDIVLVGTSA